MLCLSETPRKNINKNDDLASFLCCYSIILLLIDHKYGSISSICIRTALSSAKTGRRGEQGGGGGKARGEENCKTR